MHTKRDVVFRKFRSVGTLLASGAALLPAPSLAYAQNAPMVAAPSDAAGQSATFRFAIPAGQLTSVLRDFTAVTGVTIDAPDDVIRGITSAGVSGTFTAAEALARLLEGTALSHQFTTPASAKVEIRTNGETVEVTGQAPRVENPKYATTLSSTPQTIQVIPQSVMTEQATFTLSDALRNVPGITLQAGEGGGASSTAGDMFNMRGFSAANSLFVDNVRDDGLISRDVYNLEQVEVYLGPTGSDVGRGNAAGYVNMATKSPQATAAYGGIVSFGSASNKRLTADINQPLAMGDAGSWLHGTAFRLNALWQDAGVAGRDYAENERKSVAPSLALGLGTPTRVMLAGQFTHQDNVPDYGVPSAGWTEPFVSTVTLSSKPVDQSNYYGSPDYDYDKADQNSVTARFEQDFSRGWTLHNQTRANKTTRDAVITSIGSPASFNPTTELVSYSRQANYRKNEILSNQTSVTGRTVTGTLTHALSLGLEFIDEKYSAPGMGGAGTRDATSIYDPNPFSPVLGYAPAPTGATTDGQTVTQALSAFDVVNVGRWQFNGGVRWEHYDTDYHAVTTAAVVTDIEANDSIVSGKLGALYQLTPSGNLYVSFGSTATPPGSGNFALSTQANNANNPNVDPQVSRNLEFGSKWDLFSRRLSLTGAIFRTHNTNVIYTIDATTVPPLYNQDDGQLLHGVTLGATGQINDRWSVLANVAYLDGEQQSQNPATNGKVLTLMPKWSGSLWSTYQSPVKLAVSGGIRFTDDTFVNTANTIVMPSYYVIDAVASYPVTTGLTLRLNMNNLTDHVYVRNVNNNGGRYNPGYARSVLLSAQVGF